MVMEIDLNQLGQYAIVCDLHVGQRKHYLFRLRYYNWHEDDWIILFVYIEYQIYCRWYQQNPQSYCQWYR